MLSNDILVQDRLASSSGWHRISSLPAVSLIVFHPMQAAVSRSKAMRQTDDMLLKAYGSCCSVEKGNRGEQMVGKIFPHK